MHSFALRKQTKHIQVQIESIIKSFYIMAQAKAKKAKQKKHKNGDVYPALHN